MLEGKAVVGETDMLQAMQQEALNLASKALDSFDVTEPTDIARFIKKVSLKIFNSYIRPLSLLGNCFEVFFLCATQEFDRTYGGGWQCIVGTDFGSFVTHCSGCFIYFCVGSLAILLFRGSSGPEAEPNQFTTALETSVVTPWWCVRSFFSFHNFDVQSLYILPYLGIWWRSIRDLL